jgi:YVTN family beta-propeller protein
VLGALVLAASLAASPAHARLIPPAAGIVGGQQATATIALTGSVPRSAPRVRFAGALAPAPVSVLGRKIGHRGRYRVRFTLPLGGRWTYRIIVGRKSVGSGVLEARADSRLPQAQATPICAGAGAFWPTETLAVDFGSAWVACKEHGSLLRLQPQSLVRLGGSTLIAVATGFGSVWALDGSRAGTLVRIDPTTRAVAARIEVGTSAAYNVWTGAGSVWVAGDQGSEVVRIDPATNRVVAHVPVGDGPADLAFDGSNVYVIDHRDGTLFRVDARTNASQLVTRVPGDAPERMVLVRGHLWITGRGTDLLEVDPASGSVVVASGDTVWVPSRNAEVDARGLPTMEALRRVDARSGAVTSSLAASAPLDVHGLVADGGGVWLADNTHGVLYRVAG